MSRLADKGRLVPFMSALLLAAMLCCGCGGDDSEPRPAPNYCAAIKPLSDTPDPGSGPVDCSVLDGLELYILDDFEPGSASSGWYINNDRTALMEPLPDTDPIPTTEIPGGRCLDFESDDPPTVCNEPGDERGSCDREADLRSLRAVRVRSGFLSANGGVFGRNLPREGCIPPDEDDPETLCPYLPGPPEVGPCSTGQAPSPPLLGCNAALDFGDWDGVLFWARKAPGSYSGVRVRLSDESTDEASCVCNPFTDQNDTSDGCDKFGQSITLAIDFKAYIIPFRDMQQGGWGMSSPGLDTSELMSFGIEFGRGAWDMWIDDIAFYRSKR